MASRYDVTPSRVTTLAVPLSTIPDAELLAVTIDDPKFQLYIPEIRARGLYPQWEAANKNPNFTLGSILKDAVVFYGAALVGATAMGAINPAAAAATSTTAAAAVPAVPAVTTASTVAASTVPAGTAAAAAGGSGVLATVAAGAGDLATMAATTIVGAKVAQAVAPAKPSVVDARKVQIPTVADTSITPLLMVGAAVLAALIF